MRLFLYHGKTSTCSSKVRLVLSERALAWDGQLLDLGSGETRAPEYLKLNPNGVVPTLLVDGVPVIESGLIVQLLDEIGDTPTLTPDDPVDRAHMRLWLKRIDDDLHPAISTLAYATSLRRAWKARPEDEREALLLAIADPSDRGRKRLLLAEGTRAASCRTAAQTIGKFMADLGRAIEKNHHVVGSSLSLADLAPIPYFHRLELLGYEGFFSSTGKFGAWYARLKERTSFKEAVLDWMNESDTRKYSGFEAEMAALFEGVSA